MNEPRYLNTTKSRADLGQHSGHCLVITLWVCYFSLVRCFWATPKLRPTPGTYVVASSLPMPPTNPIRGESKATFSNCHLMFLPFCFATLTKRYSKNCKRAVQGKTGSNNKAKGERYKKGPETFSSLSGCFW